MLARENCGFQTKPSAEIFFSIMLNPTTLLLIPPKIWNDFSLKDTYYVLRAGTT